ncbi:Core-2/I-branching beta-1,6-N-acetylglucosaminyltransferase family protein [Prunus dulcis]|uniref:Core-2/I-branching beta-1,6-N-acetylglucosaminyltransferase family protein n=1 Tax=Prunus dulcis TaxID=3755 RepID=A0A5H2XQA1_PRUDU|nr:Core-2/I-branching beta-1,6-N-acetylglucosaminyltransferase family protein [Prunus dulcis]
MKMKKSFAWRPQLMKDIMIMSKSRPRPPLKRPTWIIALISFVCVFFTVAYFYPPRSSATCYLFSSSGCTVFGKDPPGPARELTDDETASDVVVKEILKTPPLQSKNPKIAFMFLTPGTLPFEELWENFFQVVWGKFSMVEAEKRLLANALLDPDNQHFVLLSDSFVDPGPHGTGRYSEHMLPEVEKKDFRKGSQWFSMKRQHAIVMMADSLYYTKFKLYCRMKDPSGLANWSVTYVDWSEGKWHPRAYRTQDVTYDLLRNITVFDIVPNLPALEIG